MSLIRAGSFLLRKYFPERLKIIMDLATEYPRMYRLMFGPVPKLFIMDPELVKKVLTSTKCLKKPNFYRFFGWGAGLATAPGILRFFLRVILFIFIM